MTKAIRVDNELIFNQVNILRGIDEDDMADER